MNSRQRRTVERAWKYRVDLGKPEWNNYENAQSWCIKNFGKPGYKWTNRYAYATFYFKKPKEAAVFSLRWS